VQLRSIFPMPNRSSQPTIYYMTTPEITIRPAYADDQLALQRLASLDSAGGVPPHPLLVADVDGELRVALSVKDGSAIADPFFRTAPILDLLRAHARAEHERRRPPRRWRTVRSAARAPRATRRAPAWSR
jgi:hypothetical protein